MPARWEFKLCLSSFIAGRLVAAVGPLFVNTLMLCPMSAACASHAVSAVRLNRLVVELAPLVFHQADEGQTAKQAKPVVDSKVAKDKPATVTEKKADATDQKATDQKAIDQKATDQKAADPKEATSEPQTPPELDPKLLQQGLKWLFGGRPGTRTTPADQAEGTDGQRAAGRDHIDSRAPQDSKVQQVLRAAESAVQRKDWKSGQDLLQRLLDLPEDSLHRLPDGRWQSVRRTANAMLGSAPSELLDDYRTQYSGLAQQMLASAKRSGRAADFVSVATRFFHTPAGYEAANHLGALHFDRAEFGLAAAWFEDLARSPASFAKQPVWRLKAAYALRQSGNIEASQAMISGENESPTATVQLGSGPVNPTTWLNGSNGVPSSQTTVSLADWTQLYGTVARLGKAIGGEPLLSPLWSIPLTTSHTVRRNVQWLLQDLLDQDRVPILTSMPLAVGGQLLYRDLRGVRAVDLETGKTQWESIEGVSPERIIGGLPPQQVEPREAWRFRANQLQIQAREFQGQAAEYHPLMNLMFRDGNYNQISSDGRQVFVIEDHGILSGSQPGQHFGWDGMNEVQDPHGVPWKSNRLVSYDLRTGRPVWSIGGVESQESFDLPLAGSYFYGVPAVDGDELLVVTGKGDDVRLCALDRATGTLRWSQLIAYSDTKIDQDIGRRWYSAPVASSGGIVICPTTVGWLVAVDRLRQSVLWAHRFQPVSASPDRDQGAHFVQQRDLASQWSPAAPIIAGSVVVYTPPEESIILALNVLNGKRLWEKPKESWLYLAGVFDDRVILVGRTEIGALALATGKPLWTVPFKNEATPSGRGLAVDDHFYLPLSTGELRTIDLKTGQTVSQTYVPSKHPPLGNLVMHRGKLVSLGPFGAVGFGQRAALLAEIQRRKAVHPTDSWSLLRESEVHLLNRDHAAALPLLRAITPASLATDDERERHHTALVESLATSIRLDPKSHAAELAELSQIAAAHSDEQRLVQELTANRHIAEGRFAAAFDLVWSLSDSTALNRAEPDAAIPRSDDRQVTTQRIPWIAERLSEIWSASDGEERTRIDSKIAALLAEAHREIATATDVRKAVVTPARGASATEGGSAAKAPAAVTPTLSATMSSAIARARLLAFHSTATTLREAIVEDLAAAGDFGNAQLELLKRADDPNRVVVARALERLARLMDQFQMPADAAHYRRRLSCEYADVTLSEGRTVATLIEEWPRDDQLNAAKRPFVRPWDDRPLQLVQGTLQYQPASQEVSQASPLPYFRSLAIEIQPQEQRLAFESLADGSFAWLAPLRSSPRGQGEGYVSADFLGHQVAIINRDVLHLFSPVERRLLWSKPLDGSSEGGPFWRQASRPQPQAMLQTTSRDSGRSMSLLQSAQHRGRLAVAQPNYLCLYGRRSITVLDPRTGEELWRKDGLPQYSQVLGTRDAVFIVPQDQAQTQAYRASDGQLLKADGLGRLIASALLTRDDSLLVLEPGSSFLKTGQKTLLRLVNPLTKQVSWKIEFPPQAFVSPLDDDELLVVPKDGKSHPERVEVSTGRRSLLEPLPANALSNHRGDIFALADDDHVYLLVNGRDTSGVHYYGDNLLSIRVHGVVYAWNRSDGKLAWRQEVKNQHLVVDRFNSSPVLLFVSRSWKQKGNLSYSTLSIHAIHKQSGKTLHNSTTPTMYGGGFHSIQVNPSEPSIELRSHNMRMRLVPENGAAAVSPNTPETAPVNE